MFARAAPLLLALSLPALAAAPNRVSIQGVLRKDSGALEEGALKFRVLIYAEEGATTALLDESFEGVPVSSGIFNLEVGEKDPQLSAKLAAAADPLVAISVDDKPLPKQRLNSSFFALHAATAAAAVGPLAGQLVPPGMIAMFAGPCPTGWTEYTALRGRFPRGEPAGNSGSLDTGGSDDAVVVEHTHAISASSAAAGDHSHSVSGSTNVAGSHTHSLDLGMGYGAGALDQSRGRADQNSPANRWGGAILPSGDHQHAVNGGTSTNGSHSHAVAASAASSGVPGAGRNVPAYKEVIYCSKD